MLKVQDAQIKTFNRRLERMTIALDEMQETRESEFDH